MCLRRQALSRTSPESCVKIRSSQSKITRCASRKLFSWQPFVRRLRHIIAQWSLTRLESLGALGAPLTPLHSEFVANYISGAVIGVTEWWLENERPLTPETLANYTLQLCVSGMYPHGMDSASR